MIRVMVVDDEPPIQRIICRKIEDADAEFQVTATTYNGEEALELLEKGETDVLFADVSMPVMDGLELLEEVNRRDIPVIPVILSGYKEFDYVRRAFSNHVTDYLLKPLNDNELKMLLCRIKKIIQQKRFEEHAQDFELALSGQERLSDGKSGEQCLLLIMVGNGKEELAGAEPDHKRIFQEMHLGQVLERLVDPMHFWIVDGRNSNEKVVFIKKGYEPKISDINRFFAFPDMKGPPVTVVYCRDGVDMPDVYDVYRSMRRYAWDNMVFLRSSLFIFDLSDRDPGSPESEDMKQEIKGLLRRYGSEGVEGIYPALEELIKEFLERPVKYKDAVKQIKYFFSLMCKEYIVDRDYIELEDGLEYILENCSTGDSMLREFRFLIGEEFSPSANGEKDKETLAGKIKGFLDANYKRNISSQILTEHFGFVSSYLSSIFKSYYGQTPMEYVTERRMEEGKRLLRQGNLRIKEVAEQLGYEDSLYFSKVFKRLEGISPKEYSGRGRAASERQQL